MEIGGLLVQITHIQALFYNNISINCLSEWIFIDHDMFDDPFKFSESLQRQSWTSREERWTKGKNFHFLNLIRWWTKNEKNGIEHWVSNKGFPTLAKDITQNELFVTQISWNDRTLLASLLFQSAGRQPLPTLRFYHLFEKRKVMIVCEIWLPVE